MKKVVITKSVTNWHIESVYRYMHDIYKIPSSTKEEEADLANLIQSGDEDALHTLVKSNLRFVISVAKQFQGQGLALDDLIAEGNVGLMVAARKFDYTKDLKFISYAVWWIRQAIMFAIAEQSRTVKVPMNKINNIIKINRVTDKLEQLIERDLTDEEIYNQLKSDIPLLTRDDFNESMNARTKTLSLDTPLENNKDYDFLIDMFENNEPEYQVDYKFSQKEEYDNVCKLLNTLHVLEQSIIQYEFDIEPKVYRTKSDILTTYNIDEKKYDIVHKRALDKLKKPFRKNLLRSLSEG